MPSDENVKECRIIFRGEDSVEGSVFLTKEQYKLVKTTINSENWCNKSETGRYTPDVDIYCEEFENE